MCIVEQLCLQEEGHPSLHPKPSTKHSRDTAGVSSHLHLQPPRDGPSTRQQGCAVAVLPHPVLAQITSLILPLFPSCGGRWEQSSSCASEWLNLCEGRGHRTSFLPSAPELGHTTLAAKVEKEKRCGTKGTLWDSAMLSGFCLRPSVYLFCQILWLFLVSPVSHSNPCL